MTEFLGFDIDEEASSWDVTIDGQQREILERSFLSIEDEERSKIFATAAKMLAKCSNPNETQGDSIGLGLGKVQSGKTSSFIALSALAIDNGIKVIIILAGSKKTLLNQTTERLKEQLRVSNNGGVALLTTLDRIQSIRSDCISRLVTVGKSIVITILKHQDHIDHIAEVFSNPELMCLPTIIIDDEGDQASLNTQARKRKRSTIYSSISNLRFRFSNHSYIAFTATPQANLLISTLDEIRPRFCVLIEPGSGYTGGSQFHGENEELYNVSVPDDEIGFDEVGVEGIPKSLESALSTFFVGAAIRTLRGDHGNHSMLIHTSRLRGNHQNVDEKLRLWLERWNQIVKLDSQDPARVNFNTVMKDGYEELCRTVQNIPSWEEVTGAIVRELINYQVWKVNSDRDAEVLSREDMLFRNNIFVGGSMLERGVTLPGLAVTYITRRANIQQADTVEQRARWFGYKKHYLDTCRIWATTHIRQDFKALLGHEDELWESLRLMEKEDISLDEWTAVLQLSPQFRPTRANVASAREVNLRKWLLNRLPANNENIARGNVKIAENFFDSNHAEVVRFGNIEHKFVRNCEPNYVLQELIGKMSNWEVTDWDLPFVMDLFNKLIRTGQFTGLDVVRMASNAERERTFIDGVIGRLHQGRSQSRIPSDPHYYAGDANLHENRPQLQTHFIKPTQCSTGVSTNITLVALALFIPEDLARATGRLVRGNA
ncbi:Z1 domain-containing protein [Candidatus Contubernalis alkaliaceticus]|uniref:Z1 domain-containing protein n=1 Tax=Candidatus Contubernalis alkaliaceticus TaxID=338645 RepID=UPI001F4BF09E|nr:Z1 domain-containing protein [Candidatus Contubernalis alkalaceticus]UNC91285.1 hypothetical protein HUE98_03790 [Candidatus Contubernalis alkalaceticus]